MSTKKVYIDEIGECTLCITKRSSRIRITMRPFDGIRVNIPYGLSYEKGIEFVKDKKNWIVRTRKKFAEIEKEKTIFLPNKQFNTRYHSLEMKAAPGTKLKANIYNKKIIILYPQQANPEDSQIQDFIQKAVVEALRIEAKLILPNRLKELAQKHGYQYNRVYIKNLKSRWGSCSAQNNINLNLHLMRVPDNLIDYVLLHELVHTVHKNHSAKYWSELNRITNKKARLLQAQLKQYNVHF